MLRNDCRAAGVEIFLKCRIAEVRKEIFFHVTSDHGTFISDALVVATGGMSYPQLGATGFGYALARKFGIPVTEIRPALVPLVLSNKDRNIMRKLSGISVDAEVSCSGVKFRGNILFTHRGLSGPAILQISSHWKRGSSVVIDLLPDTDAESVLLSVNRTSRELRNVLSEYVPKRLAETWCDLEVQSRPMNRYSEKELRVVAARLHAWEVKPDGTEGFDKAEVTAGGVDTEGISSKTMEAKKIPGLYFIGEVLDVTGQLGGYNLHWAWASASAAGQFA